MTGSFTPILLIILVIAVPLSILSSVIWAYDDAKKRGKPPLLVALFVLFGSWPLGLIVWIIFRPEPRLDGGRRPFNLQDFREQ